MSLRLLKPAEENEPDVLPAGARLGPWVLERVLGSGSMGRVYLARHERLGRDVALKVLHAHLLGDRRLVQRFMQEGRVVNQINHEHIVEVHDFVEEAEPPRVYCVMELLRGETLAQRLARRPLSLDAVRSITRQLADALGAAHAVGVVHRDLKPDNVFLLERDGRDDWVKVLDFGVAKAAQPEAGQLVESQLGTVLGTPQYMAPEQAAGLEVDARTDVYALGTLLYELLSGRPPFKAAAFGALAADLITKPPPPLPAHTPAGEAVPAVLRELTLRCLQKQPEDRPPTMGAVLAALERTRLPLAWRRALAAVVAVAALSAGGWWLSRRPTAPEVVAAPVALAPAPAPLPSSSPLPPPEAARPEAPATVVLRLRSMPPGATVRADGVTRGTTPLELQLPRGTTPLHLRLSLAGHRPLEREVSPEMDQTLELMLQPLPARRAPVVHGVLDAY